MFLCKVFNVYFLLMSFSDAVLETKPKNTVSLKGKRVEFKCRREKASSDSQNPIDWSFASYGKTSPQQFYFNRLYYFNSSSRYKVLTSETGQCDLIIDSVDFSYAGNYKCTSKTSEDKIKSYSAAELVVLDSDPFCKANSSDVSEEYEIIVTECLINYRGNAKPRMECTANDDRAFINSTLTINYTDSTHRDSYNTLTNLTSSVMTSSFTIPKVQTTNITCNITFILINSSNDDDSFEYFHLWTYAPQHRPKDNEDGKEKENTDSPQYIMITVACIGTLCVVVIIALLLLRKKFCIHQKTRLSRNSEPDVLLPMQLYGENTQYEEVHLQDRPGITPGAHAFAFDVQGEDVTCESEINVEDGKAKLESSKKKSESYSVVCKKGTASKAKKKDVVTGADGTVYTEVSVRPDCGKTIQPSSGHRPVVHRVQNYVPVDHTWKCPPAPPKF